MTRALLAAAVLASVVAGCTMAPAWRGGETSSPAEHDLAPLRALVAFARNPSDATWSRVPFADEVELGLGPELLTRRSAVELRDPSAWTLNPPGGDFRASLGPFSALQLLARDRRPLAFTIGPHPHCASPPMRPPREVEDLARVSVQPRRVGSCLQWFTVDAFVTSEGEIAAVTLDVWEP